MGQSGPDLCLQVQAVASALFDVPVAVQVRDPRKVQPALYPVEAAYVAQAIPARRVEYAAGREAARAAMGELGLPDRAIASGMDRAPIWPTGIAGSISHTNRLCIAALTTAPYCLGIDIEIDHIIPEDILTTVCSERELIGIEERQRGAFGLLIFSAKEATYKAQYPLSSTLIGFDALHVDVDLPNHCFTATFVKPSGSIAVGTTVTGRFAKVVGHVLTAVAIGQDTCRKG